MIKTSTPERCHDKKELTFSTFHNRQKEIKFYLLNSVVRGDEDSVKRIITEYPTFITDSSTIVTDLSGKEIKNLTPLQAAICAGDEVMVSMIKEVLLKKQEAGKNLGFDVKHELKRQFQEVYPNGISSEIAAQKIKAKAFIHSMIQPIFISINSAPMEEVKYELQNPGAEKTSGDLNKALRRFRTHFADISSKEKIFNPFYLLLLLHFYDDHYIKFNDPSKWGQRKGVSNRRDLFWVQVIGFTQRYLSASYLQTFAQGVVPIIKHAKLKRDFEFSCDKGNYMRPTGDLKNSLGYNYAVVSPERWPGGWNLVIHQGGIPRLLEMKEESLRGLFETGFMQRLAYECLIS